ncbi:hypothetical protein PAXRUDRAFT_769033, partial [Paxillus rubicundulus Ve08.2h10]
PITWLELLYLWKQAKDNLPSPVILAVRVRLPASHTTPSASASLAKLYEVASGVLPSTIAEIARSTSSSLALNTITPALVINLLYIAPPTDMGSSVSSSSANNDYPYSSPLSFNKRMATLVGIGSVLGAIVFVLILALIFLSYHRGRSIRSHCHVNLDLKRRHLSISPVPPIGSGEQGKVMITQFPQWFGHHYWARWSGGCGDM